MPRVSVAKSYRVPVVSVRVNVVRGWGGSSSSPRYVACGVGWTEMAGDAAFDDAVHALTAIVPSTAAAASSLLTMSLLLGPGR